MPRLISTTTNVVHYSPTIGRFLQTDPVSYSDDLNLFVYVKNDPINNVNVFGLILKSSHYISAQR